MKNETFENAKFKVGIKQNSDSFIVYIEGANGKKARISQETMIHLKNFILGKREDNKKFQLIKENSIEYILIKAMNFAFELDFLLNLIESLETWQFIK